MHASLTAKPIAVSCGEPAGVSPELAEAAWDRLRGTLPFVYIGDPAHLPGTVPVEVVETCAAVAEVAQRALPVLAMPFEAPRNAGVLDPRNAIGVIASIERGVALCQSGEASALCTLPIHKQALIEGAGFAYPGHTEFLCALTGADDVVMMLASDQLRVVPVTIHIALADVPAALTADLLERRLRIVASEMARRFGITRPRIAVAGLNPHAGEGGQMGREEIEVITPVLERLRAQGLDLRGPMSADTMFHARAREGYDVAVAMYHDQALIPIKTLDFDRGVNVTLGMEIVRTSPDHGTALDIAGRGVADATSFVEALKLAAKMAA